MKFNTSLMAIAYDIYLALLARCLRLEKRVLELEQDRDLWRTVALQREQRG